MREVVKRIGGGRSAVTSVPAYAPMTTTGCRRLFERENAATSIELMVMLLVLIGLFSGTSFIVNHSRTSTQKAKLIANVRTLNASVQVYKANFGDLSAALTAADVIAKLKTRADPSTAEAIPGHKGALVDPRLFSVLQSESEAESNAPRARWNHEELRFEITTSGEPGVKEFRLSKYGSIEPKTEIRTPSLSFSLEDDWIWDFDDRPAPRRSPFDEVIVATTEPQRSPPSHGPTLVRLANPTFSHSSLNPVDSYPLTLSIADPNPLGSSVMYFSKTSNVWEVSTARSVNVVVDIGDSVTAQSLSNDPDRWLDSSSSTITFTIPDTVIWADSVASVASFDFEVFGSSGSSILVNGVSGVAPSPFSYSSSGAVTFLNVHPLPLLRVKVTGQTHESNVSSDVDLQPGDKTTDASTQIADFELTAVVSGLSIGLTADLIKSEVVIVGNYGSFEAVAETVVTGLRLSIGAQEQLYIEGPTAIPANTTLVSLPGIAIKMNHQSSSTNGGSSSAVEAVGVMLETEVGSLASASLRICSASSRMQAVPSM